MCWRKQADEEDRDGDDQSRQGACGADVQEDPSVRDGGLHPDEGPEGPDDGRCRDEIGQRYIDAVPTGHRVMPELMGSKDEKKSEGKRKSLPNGEGVLQRIHTLLQGACQERRDECDDEEQDMGNGKAAHNRKRKGDRRTTPSIETNYALVSGIP